MLPTNLLPPDKVKFKNVAWFIGLDPAVKVDNFGIVVHGLFPKPNGDTMWNPFIREVFEIDHDNFTEIISWIQNYLFQYFPPRYAIIDATRDTPTAEEMEAKYGDTRVKAMTMTNSINYELKQNAYQFLEQGYAFPNTAIMKDKIKARNIAELQVQALHERIIWTEDNRPKFTHPPGKHNDLDRAWEMSLKAVRDFQLGRIGIRVDKVYDEYKEQEIPDYEDTDPYAYENISSFNIPFLNEDEPRGTFAIP